MFKTIKNSKTGSQQCVYKRLPLLFQMYSIICPSHQNERSGTYQEIAVFTPLTTIKYLAYHFDNIDFEYNIV